MDLPESPTLYDSGAIRRFNRIGLGFFIYAALSYLAQLAVMQLGISLYKSRLVSVELMLEPMFIFGLAMLPMYIVGVPSATFFLTKTVDRVYIQQRSLGARRFWGIFAFCLAVMLAGGIVGNLLSGLIGLITGREPGYNVGSLISVSNPTTTILFVVVLAPIVEEFVFRKLLIDRLVRHGEKLAILMSGLLFGLFHGNFYQFFYAFGLGCVFAYIYVRTGRLSYVIALHMLLNFIGSVITPFLIGKADISAGMTVAEAAEAMNPWILISGLYSLGLYASGILGIVLFVKNVKKLVFLPALEPVRRGTLARAILNPGAILFILLCLYMFITGILG